jgi:Arc/MetJ family transcription regulator
MTRTNIEIDDELVSRAMAKYNLPTKKSAVDLALRRLVGAPLAGDALADYLLSFEGTGWHGDLAGLRDDEVSEVG